MEEVSQLPDINRKIADWKAEVSEVREELTTLSRHLEQAAGRHKHISALAQVEHFQNQLICQREVADELFHDLKQASKRPMDSYAGSVTGGMVMGSYGGLSDRMQTFNKLFKALKSEFNEFLEKTA